MGYILAHFEWNWEEAERNLERSLQLKPNDTEMLNFLGDFYTTIAHPNALKIEMQALNLDPLHPVKHADVGFTYLSLGNLEKAIEYFSNCLRMDSSLIYIANQLVRSLVANSDLETANSLINSIQDNVSELNELLIFEMKAKVATAKGSLEEYSRIIGKLKTAAENGKYPFGRLAELYLHADMLEEAASMIEKAYDYREYYLVNGNFFISLPEEMPDHSALQAALDKPELNALFEIRRRNLKLKDKPSQN